MRTKNRSIWRRAGLVTMGMLLLGLILACSLFNQTPVARLVASVLSGSSPLIVTFDATTSLDSDGTITAYVWNFGDGTTGTGATVQHTFTTTAAIEVFTVTLTVTDDDGATAQAVQTIEVRADSSSSGGTGAPTARIMANHFIGVDPLTVTFDASTSTSGSGSIAAYNWNFADGNTATGAVVTHTFSPEDPEQTTTYPVTVFVWNTEDLVDTAQLEIVVIVPDEDGGGDDPEAEVFVDDPDLIFESDNRPTIPSLFEVTFDPRGSSADAGHRLEYFAWDFGDGTTQVETSNLQVTHIYELAAPTRTYIARLTIFDDHGLEDTVSVNITLIQDEEEDEE